MSSVLLYEIEPLFPRGPGEIDPGVRGPHAHGIPMSLPYPTSILGVLATTLYNLGCVDTGKVQVASSVEGWYKDLEKLFGLSIGKSVRGSYVFISNGDNTILLSSSNGWVMLDALYEYLPKLGSLWIKGEYFSEEYFDLKRKLTTVQWSDIFHERVSISLEYGKKTVREHYFTTIRFLDYRKLVDHIDSLKVEKASVRVALGIDVYVDLAHLQCSIMDRRIPVRALGRGRVGILGLSKDTILEKAVRKHYDNIAKSQSIASWGKVLGDSSLALYVASPLLLRLNKVEKVIESTVVYPGKTEIENYLKEEIEKACNGRVKEMLVDGTVSVVGLGYSLRFHERKPLYNAVMPGSIIYVKVEKCESKPRDLYIRGLGVLSHLGFGTIIPVPLQYT